MSKPGNPFAFPVPMEPEAVSGLPLFDRFRPTPDVCRGRHDGSPESEAANEFVEPAKERFRQELLRFLRARGSRGATTWEASQALGMAYTTASARLSELLRDGRVVNSGRRRPTGSRCTAAVRVLAEYFGLARPEVG